MSSRFIYTSFFTLYTRCRYFLSYILPPPITSPILRRSISSFFSLQPLLVQDQWYAVYIDDLETRLIIKHLHHNALMYKLCIDKLAVTYRNAIANNLLCIINDRLVSIEPVTVSINHVYRIIVP